MFDDTKLMTKNPGNQAETEIRVLKGEMVVFRGDLFHSGAAYEKKNGSFTLKRFHADVNCISRRKIQLLLEIFVKKMMEVVGKI